MPINQNSAKRMNSFAPSNNQIRRPEKRVFGKDITNLNCDKAEKNQSKSFQVSLQLKYIPNVKSLQPKLKTQTPIYSDPINQYKQEILGFMLRIEQPYLTEIESTFITKSMRQVLIDWLIDVSVSFELKEQTLHLALSYMNLFQSNTILTKEQYQLAGITCLWIASKYEEIYPPRINNYIDVTANTYTLAQLRKMQERVLQKLQFNLNHVTMLGLLEASYEKPEDQMLQIQKKSIAYAKYIMELLILEGNYLQKNNPSKIVSTVLLVCNSVFKTKIQNRKLVQTKKYAKQELYECYKQIVDLLRMGKSYGSDALKRKYQTQKYYKVGKLKIQLKNQQKPLN